MDGGIFPNKENSVIQPIVENARPWLSTLIIYRYFFLMNFGETKRLKLLIKPILLTCHKISFFINRDILKEFIEKATKDIIPLC